MENAMRMTCDFEYDNGLRRYKQEGLLSERSCFMEDLLHTSYSSCPLAMLNEQRLKLNDPHATHAVSHSANCTGFPSRRISAT